MDSEDVVVIVVAVVVVVVALAATNDKAVRGRCVGTVGGVDVDSRVKLRADVGGVMRLP